MKLILTSLLALILTSCTVEGWQLERAVELCDDRGGIDYYGADTSHVRCMNGELLPIVTR